MDKLYLGLLFTSLDFVSLVPYDVGTNSLSSGNGWRWVDIIDHLSLLDSSGWLLIALFSSNVRDETFDQLLGISFKVINQLSFAFYR